MSMITRSKANVPKSKVVKKETPVFASRMLTKDEIADDLALRVELLEEAVLIRRVIGGARTPHDFAFCNDRADALWHKSCSLVTAGPDEMFITDCCVRCREAKLGSAEHGLAIRSIKAYIASLKQSIRCPPGCVYEIQGMKFI